MHQVDLDTPQAQSVPLHHNQRVAHDCGASNRPFDYLVDSLARAREAMTLAAQMAGATWQTRRPRKAPQNDIHQKQIQHKPVETTMIQSLFPLTTIRRSVNALFAILVLGMASGLLLPGGAQAQVLIQNCATITASDQADSDLTNNTNCADVNIPAQADLSLTKTVDNPTPGIGATINFTLTLTNDGPSDVIGVVVNDPEPSGFTFVSGTPADLGDTWNGLTNDWTVASLASGASTTLVIQATVNASGSYINQAQVTL